MSSVDYKIVNLVITSDFLSSTTNGTHQFNLEELQDHFSKWNGKYDDGGFPAVMVKIPNPKGTVLFFGTGKIVVVGLSREGDMKKIMSLLASRLINAGVIQKEFPINWEYKIVNMVVQSDFKKKINLDEALLSMNNTCYEPERFPALIHHMQVPRCVALIFASGKVNFVGLKSFDNILTALDRLQEDAPFGKRW